MSPTTNARDPRTMVEALEPWSYLLTPQVAHAEGRAGLGGAGQSAGRLPPERPDLADAARQAWLEFSPHPSGTASPARSGQTGPASGRAVVVPPSAAETAGRPIWEDDPAALREAFDAEALTLMLAVVNRFAARAAGRPLAGGDGRTRDPTTQAADDSPSSTPRNRSDRPAFLDSGPGSACGEAAAHATGAA